MKTESVYECKFFEFDNDDPAGCGESWSFCKNEKLDRQECGCKFIYAQKACPYYEKGKLRGKWAISDFEKEAAQDFAKQFNKQKVERKGLI